MAAFNSTKEVILKLSTEINIPTLSVKYLLFFLLRVLFYDTGLIFI